MADGSVNDLRSSSKKRFSFVSSSNRVHPVVGGSSSEASPLENTTEQKESHDRCVATLHHSYGVPHT